MNTVDKPTSAPRDDSPRPAILRSHLPSLDGMRAISILMVVVAHGSGAIGHPVQYCLYLGNLGVSIFFVISGLLITWLMIRERDATGAFSLPNFYIRRFLRIIPVFWLLLLTVTVLKVTNVISISSIDILRALTFTHNYPLALHSNADYSWWLHHTWSLSLEEQFYLVWPGLFVLLPRRYAPRLAVTLAFCGPVLRIANYYLFPVFRGAEWGIFQTRIDIFMAGCASAYLIESSRWSNRIRKIPVWFALSVASLVLLFAIPMLNAHLRPHTRPYAVAALVLPTVEAALIAVALLVVIEGTKGIAFKVLNWPALQHIGKLSYGLYLWQQLFLAPYSSGSLVSLLLRLGATYLVALCSFTFFEKPFFGLRRHFRHGVAV